MTYVDDVTQAFLLAASTEACYGRVFNLGGSPPASLRELADMMVTLTDGLARYTVREFPADRALIDIGSYHADDTAFRSVTGWQPGVDLQSGISRTLEWFATRLAAYL
jgi:UDP-glucose 4-epimerase